MGNCYHNLKGDKLIGYKLIDLSKQKIARNKQINMTGAY